jgi:uncharacterized membrane protein HdeD (DUF308 family)
MGWQVRIGLAGIIAVIGFFVMVNPVSVTGLSTSVIPWLLTGVGVIYVIATIARRRRRLFSLLLPGVIGVLFIYAGLSMKLGDPETAGPSLLTFLFALLLFGSGTAKALMALPMSKSRYFPVFIGSAGFSLVLGFIILLAWRSVAGGFIGLVLGLEIVAAALFLAALALRDRDKEEAIEELGRHPAEEARGKPWF